MSKQTPAPLLPFYILITDVFAGELNYSAVNHYIYLAKDIKSCINRIRGKSGMKWKLHMEYDGEYTYYSKSGCTAFIVRPLEEEDEQYHISYDERKEK